MPWRCAVIVILAVALAGCRRHTGPDANYQKASQLFQQLYATELDDAYGDPKIDEVVALLKQVAPRSIDAERASQMLGSIERGRAALAKERAEREKLTAAASATSAVNAIDPSKVIASSAPEDAGPPRDPFGEGASIAEINHRRIADPSPPQPPAPPPDAGPPRPAPAAQATAPDAGAPVVQYYYPGQPRPGYVPPDAGQE